MAANHEPIELPILAISDEDSVLYDIDPNAVKTKTVFFTFYSISAISPLEEGKQTEIWTDGTQLVCELPYETVKKMIETRGH